MAGYNNPCILQYFGLLSITITIVTGKAFPYEKRVSITFQLTQLFKLIRKKSVMSLKFSREILHIREM